MTRPLRCVCGQLTAKSAKNAYPQPPEGGLFFNRKEREERREGNLCALCALCGCFV